MDIQRDEYITYNIYICISLYMHEYPIYIYIYICIHEKKISIFHLAVTENGIIHPQMAIMKMMPFVKAPKP